MQPPPGRRQIRAVERIAGWIAIGAGLLLVLYGVLYADLRSAVEGAFLVLVVSLAKVYRPRI